MPIADPVAKRAYQREWCRRRRARYLADRSCEWCASGDDLHVHHRDPSAKVHHAIWSWAIPRLEAELAKCIVLCRPCHQRAHGEARRVEAELRNPHGTYLRYKLGCRCSACRVGNKEYQRGRTAAAA